MTSTRLTQQNRSREWAAALRAATHRPQSPAPAIRGTAPTPDPTRHTSPGWPRPTRAHATWVGGRVLRSGCAVSAPTRPPLDLPVCRAESETGRSAERDETLRPDPLPSVNILTDCEWGSHAGAHACGKTERRDLKFSTEIVPIQRPLHVPRKEKKGSTKRT